MARDELMAAPAFESLTDSQFEARFESVPNPDDGSFFWDWAQLKAQAVPDDRIWTAVEDEVLSVTPGVHYVNHIGYVVTEKPWPHHNIEAVLD